MKSIKCPRCGLIGWSDAGSSCRRCEAPLGPDAEQTESARANFSSGAYGGGGAAGGGAAAGALNFCKVCHFPHARTAEACPNCGHQPVLSLVAKGIVKAAAVVFVVLLLVSLYASWSYQSRRAAVEAHIAAEYGIVDTTVHQQPQKPWFWSLFRSKPTVEEIFAHNTEVSGGARAFQSATSQRATGEISVVSHTKFGYYGSSSVMGKVVMQAKAPNKVETELEITVSGIDAKQIVRRGFNGTRGWEYSERYVREPSSRTPVMKRELREITGPDLEQLKHLAPATGMTRLKDNYSSLLLIGQEKIGQDIDSRLTFGEREAYVVRGLNKENKFETFYFDIETGLLSRLDFEADRDGEVSTIECYLKDYRDVGDLKIPSTITYKIKDALVTIVFKEFDLKAFIDDSVFEMPTS